MTKIMIACREEVYNLTFSDSIPALIDKLRELENLYINKGWQDIQLAINAYQESVEIMIYGKRLETDQEYKKRLEQKRRDEKLKLAAKKKKLEKDRLTYEKLKRQFENG